ncbi:PilT/PilU family type 4a pilus ATPase [Kiritimatiellota bacterium B12222]|nr:PilT/PilU family type 4a pilus ATPase [Kiritimatiellota bacterium B12222]
MNTLLHFIYQAVEADASDIHLKIGRGPIYRLEGQLYNADAPPVTQEQIEDLIETMLPPKLKAVYDEQQQVDFSWNLNDQTRFRGNLFNSSGEPCLNLRYVKNALQTFETLNLPSQLAQIAMIRRGIVLLSGTTGSGKSTTLGAMINFINDREFKRIITVEDPVEYLFQDNKSLISQREVGFDTQSFQTGLKAALRQDPDIIMVGEIRDKNSVETAITAAETGHLIFSTVHTENAVQGVQRILDMFPSTDRHQIRLALSQTLQAIICQRLIPGTNGKARPACEILRTNALVRKLIIEEAPEKMQIVIEGGEDEGMISFNQSLYKMVKANEVSTEVALEYASNPEALKMNLKGIFLDTGKRIVS